MLKDQIADAFQRYFHQFGFKKTSVDEVAHDLQISKKTIYQQFSSKEEILQYIIQRNAQVFLQGMLVELPQKLDERQRLEQLIRMIHRVARDFQQQNVSQEFQFRLEIADAAYHQAYAHLLAELVSSGVQRGVFHCIDLQTTIHYVDLVVTESLRWMLQHPEKPVEEETVRAVLQILA